MECHEYERLFEKYFNREITILEYKAVRSHLGRCQSCREIFFDHLFTLDLLDSIPAKEPGENISEQVMKKLPKVKDKMNWRRWGMGIAASLILALSLTVIEQTIDKDNDGVKAAVATSRIRSQMNSKKRSVILPNNAVIRGNLHVSGDVVVLGKVYGKLQAKRVIVVQTTDSDIFEMMGDKIKKVFSVFK